LYDIVAGCAKYGTRTALLQRKEPEIAEMESVFAASCTLCVASKERDSQGVPSVELFTFHRGRYPRRTYIPSPPVSCGHVFESAAAVPIAQPVE